jgi:hypothetical protein
LRQCIIGTSEINKTEKRGREGGGERERDRERKPRKRSRYIKENAGM